MESPGRYFFVQVSRSGTEDNPRYHSTVIKRHVNHEGKCTDLCLSTTSSTDFNDVVKTVRAFKGKYRIRRIFGKGLVGDQEKRLGMYDA